MKTIEIRRHSIRSQPGAHLNQSGVTLARLVGENLGPFDRVVTSTLPRAFETAIAMGFAVDEQIELMSSYGSDVEREVPWPQSFEADARAVKRGGAAARYAKKLAEYYATLADDLANGRAALAINHGGVLELGVVASFPDADYESWGEAVDYCEGAQLFWKGGKFVNAELLRVSRRSDE
ncbi:MAG TPA: histidine phosphatase family protein [Anaerolineales bacterium]|nr:histidine phosphatase family protein [Anaerolineales bacterium]